ncbi:MAG: hypothetical protein SOY69_08675, partial [Alloprevotella sp.]|nr:hypothetical protein [Alloprevotella sp.]
PTHLNDGLIAPYSRDKKAFEKTQPWTASPLEPWLPLAASESDTWAGYTVPANSALHVDGFAGHGTPEDPYLIYTENDLANLSSFLESNLNANFRLMNDLYMANQPAVTSIKEELNYKGTFDGNGHCIDGLRVTGHALFAKLYGTVKNLTLTNFRGNETANYNTSIASFLYGTIENCAVYGTISASGRDIYDKKVEVSGIAGAVFNDHSTYVGHIKNCVFKGTFKVSPLLNGKTVDNVTTQLRYDGICNYLNCDKGSGSSVTGCYASYTVEGADDANFTNVNRTAGVGDNVNSNGVMENNYFVCPQTPEAYIQNPGVSRAKSEADITPAMLGDTDGTVWMKGAYRLINKNTRYLTVTDPDGQTTHLDCCYDASWTPNKVYNLTLTKANADDAMLMRFRNLALYNEQTKTSYIIGLMLDRDLPSFNYKPVSGCTATKGATIITLKKEDALDGAPGHFLLCLPCPLRTADLPEGSQLHGLGYFPDNESTDNSVFYLTECDSVGAGVPCHVYIPDCESGDYTLTSYGDIVTAPQGTAEYGPQGYFKPTNVSNAYTGIQLSSDNKTPLYLTYSTATTKMKLFDAAATSENHTDEQLLSVRRVIDEDDPYLYQFLHNNNWTIKSNLYVKRALVGGQWNTLTLPFDIDVKTLAEHCGQGNSLEVQKLSSITTDGGGLVLNFEAVTEISSCYPYLVKPTYDCAGFDMAGTSSSIREYLIRVTKSDSENQYEVTMHPYYVPTVLVEGDYFLMDDKFFVVAEGMTVKSRGLRARFTANAAASEALQSARLVFDNGDVTGIDGIARPAATNGAVYDLSGRRVEKPAHGLYIVNGRKVLLP